jgi:sulfate/thiosulfate transport system permease protein
VNLPFFRTDKHRLPGYRFAMGITLGWLGFVVVLPLLALSWFAVGIPLELWVHTLTNPRVLAAFRVSMTAAVGAACIATACGVLIAWVLTRYRFWGRPVLDALVDIPFALPTAIAGIALSAVYAPDGWLGAKLASLGIEMVFNQAGIWLALVFLGIPFVVRSVQPVLEGLDAEVEEAALSLGATRWQCFTRVLLPHMLPAIISGFTLALARGFGEYGSVIFLAGNVPMVSEIVPLAIITSLESYDYNAAIIMAVGMLALSLGMLYALNSFAQRQYREAA